MRCDGLGLSEDVIVIVIVIVIAIIVMVLAQARLRGVGRVGGRKEGRILPMLTVGVAVLVQYLFSM